MGIHLPSGIEDQHERASQAPTSLNDRNNVSWKAILWEIESTVSCPTCSPGTKFLLRVVVQHGRLTTEASGRAFRFRTQPLVNVGLRGGGRGCCTCQTARGQALVEYALILALIAIVVITSLMVVGPQVESVFCQVFTALGG